MLYMIFLVWLRTGSNPADLNRFQSHIGNRFADGPPITKKYDYTKIKKTLSVSFYS